MIFSSPAFRFFVFLVLFFPLSTAFAKTPLSQAIEKAQDQQFNFQQREAVNTLTTALADFDKTTPDLENLSHLADVYLYLAFCEKNLGETEKMNRALDEAARLNPTLEPSDMLFPPSLVALFEAAKDRIWNEGRFAAVLLETKPDGARIFVNGAFKGVAPLRLDKYPAGVHYIYAVKDAKGIFKKINLKAGDASKIKLRLK